MAVTNWSTLSLWRLKYSWEPVSWAISCS